MIESGSPPPFPTPVPPTAARVSYWNRDLRCLFANEAYRDWFGRSAEEMNGISIPSLLGLSYDRVSPQIQAVLAGEKRVFDARASRGDGLVREGIVTFTPDVIGGSVGGFFMHVTDLLQLRHREEVLLQTIREVVQVLEKTKDSFRSKELGALRVRLEQVLNPKNS